MKPLIAAALGAAALTLTACGSADSAPPAAVETVVAATDAEKIAVVQETAPDFDQEFVDLVCDKIDMWTTETFYNDYGEYFHYGDGYGSDPVQAQWMVDQATHIGCVTGMADAAPVWE